MNIEKIIYNWVKENFGESEANDPSWNIELLAQEIESKLNDKLNTVDNYCESIDDHCEQILDDVDLLNTLSLVREIKEYCQEIQKTIKEYKMKLHLYKVFDLTTINDSGESPMDCCRVMTDKELRREFLFAYDQGGIPHELIDDYKGDPDYKNENWKDMSTLRVGTMIDMLNDICNYECGTGYYILETDVEVELNPAMVDDWLDTLNYWFEHIEDYGDRYPDMKPMVKRFDNVINDIYRMKKGV